MMKSKKELEYKVYRSRWPFWALPLILFLVVALFVFLTLDATGHFGCLVVCKKGQAIDKVVYAPKDDRSGKDFSKSEDEADVVDYDPGKTDDRKMMKVTGEVRFPRDKEPDSLPSSSHLEIEFGDVSLMDAPKTILGRQTIELKNYRKGAKISYSISVKKPTDLHDFYSVSAVLNVGWKKSKDDWIRKGDYLTDTTYSIKLEEKKGHYRKDMELSRYD